MSLWQRIVSFFRPKSQVAKACRELDPVFNRFMDDLRTTSFVLSDIAQYQKDGVKKEKNDV